VHSTKKRDATELRVVVRFNDHNTTFQQNRTFKQHKYTSNGKTQQVTE